MTRKKYVVLFLTVILILSVTLSLTYAAKIISVYGTFLTEGVDISISAEQSNDPVAPGMKVKYEPVIYYQGVDAYIRFNLDIREDDLKLYHFQGLSDDWVMRGNYFYYRKLVHHNEKIETFKSFHIPREWDETTPQGFMGSAFTITAYCDAVQAENFTPDFESENPWGELTIQDNDYDGSSYIPSSNEGKDKPVILGFSGAGKYTLSKEEMVNRKVLPGDTYQNEIELQNNGTKDVLVYFATAKEEVRDHNLLDALKLTLKMDGKPFYEGTLRAAELNSWDKLIYMEKGSKHKLSYEIYVPSELDNAYEEKLDDFQWNFKAKEFPDAPKTGDINHFNFFGTVSCISFLLLLFLKKKGEKNEKVS